MTQIEEQRRYVVKVEHLRKNCSDEVSWSNSLSDIRYLSEVHLILLWDVYEQLLEAKVRVEELTRRISNMEVKEHIVSPHASV